MLSAKCRLPDPTRRACAHSSGPEPIARSWDLMDSSYAASWPPVNLHHTGHSRPALLVLPISLVFECSNDGGVPGAPPLSRALETGAASIIIQERIATTFTRRKRAHKAKRRSAIRVSCQKPSKGQDVEASRDGRQCSRQGRSTDPGLFALVALAFHRLPLRVPGWRFSLCGPGVASVL